jgi:hypothetical protein
MSIIVWMLFVLSKEGGNYTLTFPDLPSCEKQAVAFQKNDGAKAMCIQIEMTCAKDQAVCKGFGT